MTPQGTAKGGPLPDFVIVGAMKSGTTTLRAALSGHPEAFCAKETHFFTSNFDAGIDWYREQFAGSDGKRVVGEKTPRYMYSAAAVELMATTIPDAKLIAILRNPMDRAYSHYWHRRRLGGKETRSFEEAIADELAVQPEDEESNYIDQGRYLKQLERMCSFYPRSELLVLFLEDLEARPAETFADVCRFLGIDDSVVPEAIGRRLNRYRRYRMNRLRKLLIDRKMTRLTELLSKNVFREQQYPPMAPATRARLRQIFAEDNRALADWLGRDLPGWDD